MTKRVVLRAGLAYVLIALVGLSLVTSATAAPQERNSITVTMFKGAWYAQAAPCLSAIDCSALPSTSPYPEETLHVALSGGDETARSYIALSFLLPQDAQLTGGTLALPVDTDATHGSVTPEMGDMVACLASRRFKPVRGSLAKPPATKCSVRKGAIYDEKKEVFTVDLDRFVEEWDTGIAALALIPSQSALDSTDSWHVVFPAAKKAEGDAPAIAATLTYTLTEAGGPTIDLGSEPEPVAAGASAGSLSSMPAPSFGALGAPAAQPAPIASAAPAPTQAISSQPAAAVTAPMGGFAGPGFAYPIVWAFPLVLLAGYGLIGRALTKEL